MNQINESWGPIYNYDELKTEIGDLIHKINGKDCSYSFYELSQNFNPAYCQGDILQINSKIPLIKPDGRVAALSGTGKWILATNTCDADRTRDYFQLYPLDSMVDMPEEMRANLSRYVYYRNFYVPDWMGSDDGFIADFDRPVHCERGLLQSRGKVLARMTRPAWFLFHACIIRYLARADRRMT